MLRNNSSVWRQVTLLAFLPLLACALARQTPQPAPTLEQLAFEIQTATPTFTPVLGLVGAPTDTPDPNATATRTLTSTLTITSTLTPTETQAVAPPPPVATSLPEPEVAAVQSAPAATPTPAPAVPTAEPVQGGAWDFEDGFSEWGNPYGDRCPGSGLANGWNAFTTRDQFGSSCFNQTVWKGNVNSGESAQEITFAYVGVQAGIFKSVPTTPGHRYTVSAFMKHEFSPAKLEVALGLDVGGGTDWQASVVQWFPWKEDKDDTWSKTEETVTVTGENMTIFIKGSHPYPEPGGTLRLDSISIADLGPE
ncbi:MAG: hypothetical protein HYR94_26715 [Chloroflexi bacterium]|nr:hypothetical protein [Chloroflexota bacterium]